MQRRRSQETIDSLLEHSFHALDKNGDGQVGVSEIQKGMQKVGVKLTAAEATSWMQGLTGTSKDTLTFTEFRAIHEKFIQNVFDTIDVHQHGYIEGNDIQRACRKSGFHVTLKEANAMITELQPVHNTRLARNEFHELYILLRAKTETSSSFRALLWDPDIRTLSEQWWNASTELEDGLRVLPHGASANTSVDPRIKFCGGALSGVIEALLLTPLDVTKTRLQLDKAARYKGMMDCGRQLFASEGFLALYKGFTPWITHVVLKNGSRFYFNAVYRSLLADENQQVSGAMEFMAGAMAGATEAVLIVTPFEVVKTRLQGQDVTKGVEKKYKGPLHTAMKVVKNEGPLALWKGLTPTIARQGLNQACSFWTNTIIKKHVWKLQEGETLPAWKSVVTGMIGAIPGPCLNCPMDVIKTRLMAQENMIGEIPKYNGVLDALHKIPKEEGVKALYKGLVPRLSRLCPSYGIQWLVMDQVTARYSVHND